MSVLFNGSATTEIYTLSLHDALPIWIARRAYVDLDPGYTQIWHESGGWDSGLEDHDLHFTVGTNIGTPRCDLPTGGLRWRDPESTRLKSRHAKLQSALFRL